MPRGQLSDRLRGARISGVGLYEYLVQQVLERQPPEVQRFLLRTALLEEFDAELCQEVIGTALKQQANWSDLIESVLRANLFIQPIGEEHIYLRYHHLFRDFLQSRMLRDYAEESTQIQASLAETWARRGEWERSYRVYQRLGRSEEIAALVERAGPDLIARGRLTTLAEWLEGLPDSFSRRPALVSLRGAVLAVRGRSEDSLALFDQAIQAFETGSDPLNLAFSLTRRATVHRLLGHYDLSLADMNRALEVVREIPAGATVRADALAGMGTAHFHLGNLTAALNWLNEAHQAFEEINDGESTAKTDMQIGMVTKALGQYQDAERAYRRALNYYQASGNLIWQANVFNNLGVLQHLRGDIEGAASSFEKAIHYARIGGYSRLEAYALASIGDLYRDLDAPEEAQEAYHQARPIAMRGNDRFLVFYLDLAEAVLAKMFNQTARAQRLCQVAWQAAEMSGSTYQLNLCRLERSAIAIAGHAYRDAIPDLEEALVFFKKEGHRVEGLRAHFYLAAARRAVADREEALSHFDQIYAASVEHGARNPLVVTGRELRFHLEAMQKEPDFERQSVPLLRLVDQFQRQAPALRRQLRRQSQTIPLGPPKLVIQTLGKNQLKVNGHVVTSAEWLTQTARDLFLLIVAHPEGLAKEEIGAMVWPDASPAELKMRFKNTIYRLRRAAGKEAILFEDENIYRFNRSLDYDEDSESFQREIELAEKEADPERKITHYRAAIKYYKGEYLPELQEDWVIVRRERLYRIYFDCLLKLAGLELERRQYDAALILTQRLLNEDACLEEAHRLGMLIHAATGNRAGVMRQYEMCRQAFQNEFKAEPSLQTQQLYRTLIK